MKLEANVISLAERLYVETIGAHYRHGIAPGETLNFDQIAGESVEAAMRFTKCVRAEQEHGKVTNVMMHTDAHRAGFSAFFRSEPRTAPESMNEEFVSSWLGGWDAGQERATAAHSSN